MAALTPVSTAPDWARLLRGEIRLTVSILTGFFIGALIIRTGLTDRLLRRALPYLKRWGVGATLGAALAISAGSAKAGAAIVAAALESGKISRRTAHWGVPMLAFPAYLRRWISTMILSCGLAGRAGGIFALTLLARSALKFAIELFILGRGEHDDSPVEKLSPRGTRDSVKKFGFKLFKSLPLAWIFYALTALLAPQAEYYLRRWLAESSFFPLPVLAVAAASFAHISAALALAGGSLAAGEMTAAQAVFALLLGNSLSIITRLLRTNAGYYFGLFPRGVAQSMLLWNICASGAIALLTLAPAALALCF